MEIERPSIRGQGKLRRTYDNSDKKTCRNTKVKDYQAERGRGTNWLENENKKSSINEQFANFARSKGPGAGRGL